LPTLMAKPIIPAPEAQTKDGARSTGNLLQNGIMLAHFANEESDPNPCAS
jgi:hypothetical protein